MHKLTLCFLCALLWLNASAQVRLSWNNRIEAPADYNAVVFRGESVVLEAALTQYGVALPLDGTATLYYAVSGTTNYTASAASISGNKLIALWTPALDSGAARYSFFLSANMSGGRIYRANGSITIQASPGAYPPIITQTGPTLSSLQSAITAAGTTNAAQQIAIGALQTGQASLTGQVNAALAMSFAAGDQATLARNTANAAALTAGVARTTGAYLAATQGVQTATLAGHASSISVLYGSSTSNYVIATGALARANEALARPVGTDTGMVTSIVGGVLETNKIYTLSEANGPTRLDIGFNRLTFDTTTHFSTPRYTITNNVSLVVTEDIYTKDYPSVGDDPVLLVAAGSYGGHYYPNYEGDVHVSFFSVPVGGGLSDQVVEIKAIDPVNTYVVTGSAISMGWAGSRSGSDWLYLDPSFIMGTGSIARCTGFLGSNHTATTNSLFLVFPDELLSSNNQASHDLSTFATTNQVNTRLPKLSVFDTNTAASVTAVIRSVWTNGYNRLFLIQE